MLVFCIYKRREGDFTLTILFTSLSLAVISANLDLTELYLKVIDCLMVSSADAMKSSDSNSMNLYSMFWIKSNVALPSLVIINTAKKLCGSLMQLFNIFISTDARSGKSIVNF